MLHNVMKNSANLRLVRGHINRLTCKPSSRPFSSKDVENDEGPIKFSTSPAARRFVTPVVKKVNPNMPWYQPYSVLISVSVFLIYFCVLREESDIDLEFDKTLYDRLHGLEKQQLIIAYKYNLENGRDVTDIERRLKEIEAENQASE